MTVCACVCAFSGLMVMVTVTHGCFSPAELFFIFGILLLLKTLLFHIKPRPKVHPQRNEKSRVERKYIYIYIYVVVRGKSGDLIQLKSDRQKNLDKKTKAKNSYYHTKNSKLFFTIKCTH